MPHCEPLTKRSFLHARRGIEPSFVDVHNKRIIIARFNALDARVILDRARLGEPWQPYRHLVLRPYPEEYVRPAALRDGTPVLLRPIKPEDEPLWKAMLASCSRETIYSRFRYFFQWSEHSVATRYCYIDYDREIAMVAETGEGGQRRLVGVGRLVADPDHETVEYAVLVSDAWQNRGLGL